MAILKQNYLINYNKHMKLRKIFILIPSLDPDQNVVDYVDKLFGVGLNNIVIVNDGSKTETLHYFDEIKKNHKEVIFLTHEVNKGKGQALKTGFKYILDNYSDCAGIVTADADGQHLASDTLKVAEALLETNDVIFGTRDFNEEIVPFKSRNGNKITTFFFKLLYGVLVNDTQTGLRGLPVDFARDCLKLPGNRFEYEIQMLIKAVEDKRNIVEVKIETVYLNSNRQSHFNPFKDSYKIYKVMFSQFISYSIVSLLSFVIDISIYTILIYLVFNGINRGILYSTVIARIISSLFNYLSNRKKVFKSGSNSSLVKYYVLSLCIMLISSGLVTYIYSKLLINSSIIKIIVDTILFIVSYKVQKTWVFKK